MSQIEFQELLREKLREAVRYPLIEVLEAEVEACIGAAAYERVPSRQDYRNGHYRPSLVTGVGEVEALPVPRTRNGFKTQVFAHYQRRQAALDEAICDMFVSGGRTAQVGQIVEKLTRTKPSPSTASWVFHGLEDEFEKGNKRRWPRNISMYLPIAPILASFTAMKGTKCRFWQLSGSPVMVNEKCSSSGWANERTKWLGKV